MRTYEFHNLYAAFIEPFFDTHVKNPSFLKRQQRSLDPSLIVRIQLSVEWGIGFGSVEMPLRIL